MLETNQHGEINTLNLVIVTLLVKRCTFLNSLLLCSPRLNLFDQKYCKITVLYVNILQTVNSVIEAEIFSVFSVT